MKNDNLEKAVASIFSNEKSKKVAKEICIRELIILSSTDVDAKNGTYTSVSENYTYTELIKQVEDETPDGVNVIKEDIRLRILIEQGWKKLKKFPMDKPF
ncbi:MAG: hypothetical protein WC908_03205 [Candidatus Paceibacterota bacterium]